MFIPLLCLAMFAAFFILFANKVAAKSQRNEGAKGYTDSQGSFEKKVLKIDMHDEYNGQNKPIARVSGLKIDKCHTDETRNSLTIVKNWGKNELSLGFLLVGGMTFKNGSLIVPQKGVYHIYSFVNFYVDDQRECVDSPLVHEITLYNIKREVFDILFQNTLPECKANSYYPSLLSGTALLRPDEFIVIRVSHIYLLVDQSQWHYFGAYLI